MLGNLFFSEPIAIPDTYVSGLADAEQLSPGLWRLTFFSRQRSLYDGEPENIAVAKFVVTGDAIVAICAAVRSAKETETAPVVLRIGKH